MNLLDVKHCLNASQYSKFFMEQCCHLADCTRKTEVLVHTKKEKHFWSEGLLLKNQRARGQEIVSCSQKRVRCSLFRGLQEAFQHVSSNFLLNLLQICNFASQLMRSINHSDYFTPARSQLKAKNSRSSVNDSVTNKVTKCTPSHALGGKFSLIIVG